MRNGVEIVILVKYRDSCEWQHGDLIFANNHNVQRLATTVLSSIYHYVTFHLG